MAEALVRTGVAAFAIIVFCGLLLGAAGWLTLRALLVAQTVVFAAAFAVRRPAAPGRWRGQLPVPIPLAALVGALLAFAVAFGITHSPLTLYDSISYHLFFSARWVQDHVLSVVPTPFSDEAQAYAPANGELFFAWLMLPFHGDLAARIGQLPFALLAAATLYALARRLGAAPEHAVYPAGMFFFSRPILEQAIGANVDLICAAMFLAALYLGILAVDRDERRDWIAWGVALGLYFGTKYVALVYAPVFVLLAVARGPRPKTAWALPGLAAFALPWYARNWVLAGSPIYPATLRVAGLTIARGAFTRGAMLNTIFHTNDVRLFPIMLAHAAGPTFVFVWAPLAAVGAVGLARRGWWPHGFVIAVPALMLPLYWYGFPVNIDSRFLMPALGPAILPIAFAFGRSRRWNAVVHGACTAGIVWTVVGAHVEIPAQVPWFMQGWLVLDGLVGPAFVAWFAALTGLLGAAWWALRTRTARTAALALACLVAGSAAALAAGTGAWCRPARCDYLDTTPAYIRVDLYRGWLWLGDHVHGATVAYTGINLPYPLTGDRLTNRVVYANIDGHPRWRFHDYDLAYRAGRFAPAPPVLAVSSGELKPIDPRPGPRSDAVRPRYERLEGDRAAWIGNLQVLGVTHLFISALSAYEIDYVWHNDRGFPIEDEWAKADPAAFHLEYANRQVRVYAVNLIPREAGE